GASCLALRELQRAARGSRVATLPPSATRTRRRRPAGARGGRTVAKGGGPECKPSHRRVFKGPGASIERSEKSATACQCGKASRFADAAVIRSRFALTFSSKMHKRSRDSAADLMEVGISRRPSAVSGLQETELPMGHKPREKFKRLSAK